MSPLVQFLAQKTLKLFLSEKYLPSPNHPNIFLNPYFYFCILLTGGNVHGDVFLFYPFIY